MPDPYYTGPLVEIVGFNFGGPTVTITGGTDVSVLAQAIVQLAAKFETAKKITVKVTGPVTHLTWGTPADWLAAGSPVESFKLVNQSVIAGKGGAGGAASPGANTSGYPPVLIMNVGSNGAAGGHALDLDGWTVSVDNGAGHIFGGAGGGGGGGAAHMFYGDTPTPGEVTTAELVAEGGGGGAGPGGLTVSGGVADLAGLGTIDQSFINLNVNSVGADQQTDVVATIAFGPYSVAATQLATNGASAGISSTSPTGGTGGLPTLTAGVTDDGAIVAQGGAGGIGGGAGDGIPDFGKAGQDGFSATVSGSTGSAGSSSAANGGTGGAAGKAVNLGGGAVTWLSGDEPARVKGAVS